VFFYITFLSYYYISLWRAVFALASQAQQERSRHVLDSSTMIFHVRDVLHIAKLVPVSAFWAILGACSAFCAISGYLAARGDQLVPFSDHLGSIWDHFGTILALLGHFGAIWSQNCPKNGSKWIDMLLNSP
jgi:hypothetical protein